MKMAKENVSQMLMSAGLGLELTLKLFLLTVVKLLMAVR